jgi:hypothetical protein
VGQPVHWCLSRELHDTGWNVVRVPLPGECRGACIQALALRATSLGDGWDRLVAIGVDGCEVLRVITPFDAKIEVARSLLDRPESWLLYRARELWTVFTTWEAGGGGWRMELGKSEAPRAWRPIRTYPLWFVEHLGEGGRNRLAARVNARVDSLVLNVTGHRHEEGGGVNRTFVLRVDGREVWRQTFPDWRWRPGCGVVEPVYVEYSGYAGTVELECPDCGNMWAVSGWAYAYGGASPVTPELLRRAAPAAVAFGTALAAAAR